MRAVTGERRGTKSEARAGSMASGRSPGSRYPTRRWQPSCASNCKRGRIQPLLPNGIHPGLLSTAGSNRLQATTAASGIKPRNAFSVMSSIQSPLRAASTPAMVRPERDLKATRRPKARPHISWMGSKGAGRSTTKRRQPSPEPKASRCKMAKADGRSVAEAVCVCTGPLAILERDMWIILVLRDTTRRDRYSLRTHANLPLHPLPCGLHHRPRDRPNPVQPISPLRRCPAG